MKKGSHQILNNHVNDSSIFNKDIKSKKALKKNMSE